MRCTWIWIVMATGKSKIADVQFAICRKFGSEAGRLKGAHVAEAMAQFVREKHITHVIFREVGDRGMAEAAVYERDQSIFE